MAKNTSNYKNDPAYVETTHVILISRIAVVYRRLYIYMTLTIKSRCDLSPT